MNIIIINDFTYVNGGASQVAISSAVGLAEAGNRVFFLGAVGPPAKELRHRNIELVVTGQFEIADDPSRVRAAIQGIWNTEARKKIGNLLGSLDISNTMVHIHGWTKALSSSVIRECLVNNFKVILTLHDYFTACPNGGFFNYKKNKICTLAPLSMACIAENCDSSSFAQKQWRVARQLMQRYIGQIPNGISGFIAVSKFSSNILQPYLPAGVPVFQVSNPIDMEKWLPASIRTDAPFIYAGRLSSDKGCSLFAAAALDLATEAVFIGKGNALIAIKQANPSAKIIDWLPRDELLLEIRKARALVLPSLWYETQGLVVAEAAALGIAAIVPDTSAARDLVIDGVTGLWFKGGDRNSLKAKMQIFLESGVASEMGKSAYEHFWANPSTTKLHVENLLKCYQGVLRPSILL